MSGYEKFRPNEEDIKVLRAFFDAAVKDGWQAEATYESESIERASRLKRDGFIISIVARPKEYAGIHAWGPDGIAIDPGLEYTNFAQIQKAVNICGECKKEGPTERVAFANRACAACAPALRKKLETPGWSN